MGKLASNQTQEKLLIFFVQAACRTANKLSRKINSHKSEEPSLLSGFSALDTEVQALLLGSAIREQFVLELWPYMEIMSLLLQVFKSASHLSLVQSSQVDKPL